MAGWRDRMGPATFRGVPFYVETAELGGGRRTVRHEFPGKDVPYVEDLGRAARTFPVDGYVIGEDYLTARDALLAELEKEGWGELVHPYYGKRRVAVAGFRVRESTGEGGMARFSIDFDETEVSPAFPVAVASALDKILADIAAVGEAARAYVASATEMLSLPSRLMDSIESVVEGVGSAIETALSPLVDGAEELASLRSKMYAIVTDAQSLASTPTDAFDAIVDGVDSVVPDEMAIAGIAAFLAASAFEPAVARPPETTEARAAEQAFYDAMLWIVRVPLVMQAAQLATVAEFDNYDAAVASRDAILTAIDDLVDDADDDVYALLQQLRVDLTAAVPGEDSDLPRIGSYTPPAMVPSLVLAHRLYGNLDREADLVARNKIERPGFIPGGLALEVLSDE